MQRDLKSNNGREKWYYLKCNKNYKDFSNNK